MSVRKTPVHPPLPAAATSSSTPTVPAAKVSGKQPAAPKRTFADVDISDGVLNDRYMLHAVTYNRWNPMSSKHKFVVRFSRDALIAVPFRLSELANWNGATGVETRKPPNKRGKFHHSHG